MFSLKEGPHKGWWIMDGERIHMWCHSKEHAEMRLKELQ